MPGVLVAYPESRSELESALARFAEQGVGILVIDGGDGTIRDVLTHGARAFGDHWPRLVILPKGKTNALALDLGVPRRWTFAEAMAAARDGRVIARRPLDIERDGDDRVLRGFIFGSGAFNAAIDTGQLAHRFGAFQGLAVAVAALFGMIAAVFGIGRGPWRRTSSMRLFDPTSGAELPHSGRGAYTHRYLALFSSLRKFPLGIMPFRRTDPDIRFLLLDAPLRRVTAMLPAILKGIELPGFTAIGIHRGAGTGYDLMLDDRFILDGESFPGGRLRLRLGPELHFIVP